MAVTAGILLAVYVITIVLVIAWPSRRRHPEDGMAVGCLMMVAVACAVLGGMLFLAARFRVRWLVYVIFAMTLYPALYTVPQLVVAGWKKLKARSGARGRRLVGEELQQMLAGRTHVFHRNGVDPTRQSEEMKFYHADGKLICYEKEAGRLKQLDRNATWWVGGDVLRVTGLYGPGTRNSFTLYQTPDGRIGYYVYEPFSRLNGMLSGIATVGPADVHSVQAVRQDAGAAYNAAAFEKEKE